MAKQKTIWKKGRGKLGLLSPLIGSWMAEAETPMGKVKCTRTFEPILRGNYIQLTAIWDISRSLYSEHAIIGTRDGILTFWSFTSDGKNSQGKLADGTDVHPEAICFEAEMPAGLARMIYWPNPESGFNWAVEAKTKKGWNRFTIHHYKSSK
ncbi:MAG TPA: hypothetical protein VHQ93_13290 [Chitinophagaceae bacterium]|jgi:hypothetical protein|nr:hypothetical protein [Chitinophagaceae bacterium]